MWNELGHTKVMFLVFLALASAASPCGELGQRVLLKDTDGLLSATRGVGASATPCERYLRAFGLKESEAGSGSRDEAKRLWQSLAKEPAPLGDWAKLESARHAWLAKDETLAIAGAASAEFPQAFELEVIRRVHAAANDPSAKASLWSRLEPQPAGDRRRIQLEWLAELGLDEARRELFIEYPDSKLAPLAWPSATLRDLVRRAGVASDKHMNGDVLKTVAAAQTMQPGPADACALAFYDGAAQRKLRKYSLAEAALMRAVDMCSADAGDFRKRAHYLLGQVQIIARPLATASATLHRFAREYPKDTLADDALFGIAVATAKAGEKEEALRLYDRVASIDPPGDMCAEAAFRAAYGHYLAGRYEAASQRFSKLAAGGCGADDYERSRGAYWHARAKDRLGEPSEGLLRTLAKEQPFSFYGLLARARLGDKAPELRLPDAAAPDAEPSTRKEFGRADKLSAQGLYREAQVELGSIVPATDDEAQLHYAAALARAKQYHKSSWIFRTALRHALARPPSHRRDVVWSIAFPRPFAREVASAEAREQLESDLLLSLIREESAFQLEAGSWANAFGLTQLLVDTAVQTARDAHRKDMPTAEALRENPILSIDLGAHHMAMLQRKYKHPALILAAYNAGLGHVTRWVEARGEKPFDEFLEEIPFDETRGYVKRILRTWSIYRALAGKPLPKIDLTTVARK